MFVNEISGCGLESRCCYLNCSPVLGSLSHHFFFYLYFLSLKVRNLAQWYSFSVEILGFVISLLFADNILDSLFGFSFCKNTGATTWFFFSQRFYNLIVFSFLFSSSTNLLFPQSNFKFSSIKFMYGECKESCIVASSQFVAGDFSIWVSKSSLVGFFLITFYWT